MELDGNNLRDQLDGASICGAGGLRMNCGQRKSAAAFFRKAIGGGPKRGLHSTMHVQLLHDRFHMDFDRRVADAEFYGDHLVRVTGN